MKILYVKNNSERTKEFQLKTIIYEENGCKYVEKQAMCPEAIPHLKKMKSSYKELASSIINPQIKLAKIINETEDSLTFEFIEGISLAKKFENASKLNTQKEVIDTYLTLLQTGFKTIPFDSTTMVTDKFKTLFGEQKYTQLDGVDCLAGISNLDLIFSNIIYKDEDIYLIDYEWVFEVSVPLDFISFRALHPNVELYWEMERHFIHHFVADKNSFLKIQDNYLHRRLNVIQDIKEKESHVQNMDLVATQKDKIIEDKDRHIQNQDTIFEKKDALIESLNIIIKDKDKHIQTQDTIFEKKDVLIKSLNTIIEDKDRHIQNQDTILENKNNHIQHQDTIIHNKDTQINALYGDIQHWHNIAQEMRMKSRIKRGIKRIIPLALWNQLKKVKQKSKPINNPDIIATTPAVSNNYIYIQPLLTKDIQKEIKNFSKQPLISIIMPVYNVAPKWLHLAIKSLENQWYSNWELCIVDDKSTNKETIKYLKNIKSKKIKIHYLKENLNISGASNAALKMTTGEYIALMDNDDELTPNALYEVVKVINKEGAEFIYSDEDKLEMDGSYSDPHFKPDFAPDMFLSQNYLSHLGVIKKDIILKTKGFTLGLEGSQDFDLYLQILEHTDKIYHISKVLYHWRKIPGSTAAEYGDKSYAQEAGRKALENAMKRRGIEASVKNGQTPGTYKVDYTLTQTPLVSIIIPFKDKPELLKVCVESILNKSSYTNFEIIGISNNSTEKETFKEMEYLKSLDKRVAFYEYNVPFNYSKINNYAVTTYAKGEHILFLNNDIEVITPQWIEEMLMYSQQKQNGAVGAKLYFPNDTIQHAGLVMAPKTIHSVILVYQGYPKEHSGYGARLKCVNNYSAVTAACLMVKKEIFEAVNGFDEKRLSVAYNDVDLCLRIQEAGYHNVWTPYCELYHHESISRGYEISRESVERREKEKWNLKDKHPEIFTKRDPFYNKNLTRFSIGSELDESVKTSHESVKGIPFYEEIISSQHIKDKTKDRVCIFSHFDLENRIREDVIYYLETLTKISDIIFVSTAEDLSNETLTLIEAYCTDIIVKKNIGYDFGAWKTGMDYLDTKLYDYEELILCNDSVYGPLFDLETIFDKMQNHDLWAMTDNYEIEYHLQSYFMVYTKKVFEDKIFKDFWKNLKIYHNKQMLIENNEIGFSQQLIYSDFSHGSYYSVQDKNYTNVLHYYWKELITEHQFPFVKKELLKRNPLSLDIADWEEVISEISVYNTQLITNS